MELFYTEDQINVVAQKLLQNFPPFSCFAFYAPMGAGKTTLIKALLHILESKDNVSSPTFGIVNEYQNKYGEFLAYHFDFYRLQDEMEALDLGIEDYFSANCWIFMEWPEKISSFLPEKTVHITIQILDDLSRKLSSNTH